jgi:adenylate cyclase
LRIILAATLASAGLGAASAAAYDPADIPLSTMIGGICGLVLSTTETMLRSAAAGTLRRLPVAALLLLRMLIYGGVLIVAVIIAELLLPLLSLPAPVFGTIEFSPKALLMAALIALALNVVFLLRALLGTGTFPALLVGRYYRPRRQERIVLFLDLVGSTQLAERLGDAEFHHFLNLVFYDLTEPVLETRGEIYRYVGDEMIVSWPLGKGVRDAACIVCLFSMDEVLQNHAPEFRRRFGVEPHVRAALHAGPLVIGEMGDYKREIVLLGDTMNTAARIEEACRTTGHDYLASGAVVHALASLPPRVTAIDLGVIPLRGKAGNLELFALQRTSSGPSIRPPLSTPRARTVQCPASPAANGTGQTAEPSRSTVLPE